MSTNSKVDVINPHNIESYVDTYNDIHSTQKKTTTKINNNNTQNKIRNNNNEHNNTSTNVVNNVNLTKGGDETNNNNNHVTQPKIINSKVSPPNVHTIIIVFF